MEQPKYKIGDSVVIRTSGAVFEMVQITGAYINIKETRKEWNYYTTNEKVIPVKESQVNNF
jgi:hypothetical protein